MYKIILLLSLTLNASELPKSLATIAVKHGDCNKTIEQIECDVIRVIEGDVPTRKIYTSIHWLCTNSETLRFHLEIKEMGTGYIIYNIGLMIISDHGLETTNGEVIVFLNEEIVFIRDHARKKECPEKDFEGLDFILGGLK